MSIMPELLRCPISLEPFTDPVTLTTGQTYERASIERWLAYGNLTCPVTMQRLHDVSLVPNSTLRHLIERRALTVPDQCHHDQFPPKVGPLRAVKIQRMIRRLFDAPFVSDNVELTLDYVLMLLPSTNLDCLNILKSESRLASLELMLRQGNAKIKTSVCLLLQSIGSSPETEELCVMLGQREHIVKVLVSLVKHEFGSNTVEAGLGALCSLCSVKANRVNLIKGGLVGGLIAYVSSSDLVSSSSRKSVALALATLEVALELEVGRNEVYKIGNAVDCLVRMVFRVSLQQVGSEHAVGCLMMMCRESKVVQVEAINAGVWIQLLLLLQSQCSLKTRSKARDLLKLLRNSWAKSYGCI